MPGRLFHPVIIIIIIIIQEIDKAPTLWHKALNTVLCSPYILRSKRVRDVAIQLIYIFLRLGVPTFFIVKWLRIDVPCGHRADLVTCWVGPLSAQSDAVVISRRNTNHN